jgi:hypothetical protein
MTPSHTRKGSRHYRYYVCCAAQKRGWQGCPSKAVPAGAIEQIVLEQIQERGRQTDGDAFTIWERLSAAEQVRLVPRWIERIDYDGATGTVAITFYPDSSHHLAQQPAQVDQEKSL